MQQARMQKINVFAVFANFKTADYQRRITPVKFNTPDGYSYEVEAIRRTYIEKVGDSSHVHFVVKTKQDRYFDIVYDSRKMTWFMVLELEDTFALT